ncbi:MAG: hypothetical protein AUH30_19040 [Candidatus Rokubacteria bacterium 13_1_40CM_68_15]|nr:MAG: hypothetical protein AUH30_19040 [Candidatus Rokubacteria bacterium 13_1_40CM_68_15]
MADPRSALLVWVLITCSVATLASGCRSTGPLLRSEHFDFVTTGLFSEPCKDSDAIKQARREERRARRGYESNAAAGECSLPDLDAMVLAFMAIQEADEARGVPGDTIAEVRERGFSIFSDSKRRIRRPNTRVLYGNDALGAVGMGVAPPPLQRPEDIKAYTDFMGQLYAEEYVEKDVMRVTDRYCLNNRETLDTGDERTFSILWRAGHVIKRVVKGGPVHNPKRERAFLLCPGSFITDTLGSTLKSYAPVK